MATTDVTIEQLAVDTIRTLSIDMVENANSGHPGMPMGAAPMAYELWANHLKHNPANPNWFDRDRFVLSAGHGSALLYSLLHLSGYDLPLEELKRFRQWESKTPGHPEFGHTPGVEATTGPLGQGIAMAVGMALAEAHLAATYNTEKFKIIDHYTYTICGDGDLMEGVASEAASLAGHLGLGKLIVLYDSNDISLDGELHLSFTENIRKRFESYGWQYLLVEDGNDRNAIGNAIREAKNDVLRPTIIEVKTVIGYGSPNKAGKSSSHGSPLGEAELQLTKQAYGWTHEPFFVPEEVKTHFQQIKMRAADKEAAWCKLLTAYEQEHPELYKQLKLAIEGKLPENWDQDLPVYETDAPKMATREASGAALNAIAKKVPSLIGGSADLASSNLTHLKGFSNLQKGNYAGRNIWFGVREFAMGAALNGLALHGGVRPFGGTFFVFCDYLRPAIRLSALMKLPVLYVLTHDSIAVGEDGPTHEPIEQLPSLRAMPNLIVLRPADANETIEAYRFAMEQKQQPVAMVLSRQKLPVLKGTSAKARHGVGRGAYVLSDTGNAKLPDVLLMGSGSEVQLLLEAQQILEEKGIAARVISMPSWDLFEKQSREYQESVILPHVKARVAVEMAHPQGWERYVGDQGAVIGVTTFGASAPGEQIMNAFGFTVENIVQRALNILR